MVPIPLASFAKSDLLLHQEVRIVSLVRKDGGQRCQRRQKQSSFARSGRSDIETGQRETMPLLTGPPCRFSHSIKSRRLVAVHRPTPSIAMPLYWLCYRHNNQISVVIEPGALRMLHRRSLVL